MTKGFTLIEMLVSVAIILALAAFSIPLYQSLQVTNDLDIAADTLVSAIRRAELLSQGSLSDATWGVFVAPTGLTLFQGASYASRNTAADELFPFGTTLTIGGNTEIVFAKVTGAPTAGATQTSLSALGRTRTITVNTRGAVSKN